MSLSQAFLIQSSPSARPFSFLLFLISFLLIAFLFLRVPFPSLFLFDSYSVLPSPHSPAPLSLIALWSPQPQMSHNLAKKASEFKRNGIYTASPYHRFRVLGKKHMRGYMYLHVPTSIPQGYHKGPSNRYTTDDHPPPPAIPSSVIRPPSIEDEWNRRFRGTAVSRSQQEPTAASRNQQELAEPTRRG